MAATELLSYFADTFNMVDDFERNLDLLLKRGMVEANNRIDTYSNDVDQIKITNYGAYMFSVLAYDFTYLDLINTDCGIYSEQVANYLIEAARKEYSHFLKGHRLERVKVRVDRVAIFLKYLKEEELRERERFSLGMPLDETFTAQALDNFTTEKPRIIESATKHHQKHAGRPQRRH
jgi:hypothetical protein